MEEEPNKTKLKVNMCTYRRIKIEHEINDNLLTKIHSSKLQMFKYREQAFHRKINELRRNLQQIEPHIQDDVDNEQKLMTPNCFARIQNHFRSLHFSAEAQNRLLCQAPIYDRSQKHTSNQLPLLVQQTQHSNKISDCESRISFYRTRAPVHYSCRSATNYHLTGESTAQEKRFQSYLNQQLIDEQRKQIDNDERRMRLLREFDKLKHTIEDPYSTLSVLSALTRTIVFLDSAMK